MTSAVSWGSRLQRLQEVQELRTAVASIVLNRLKLMRMRKVQRTHGLETTFSLNQFLGISIYNVRDKFVDNFVNNFGYNCGKQFRGELRGQFEDNFVDNLGDNLVKNLVVNATSLKIFKTIIFEKFEDNFEEGIWSLRITNFLNQDIIAVNHPFSVLFLHPSAVTRLRLHSQPWAKLLQVLLTALSSWAAAVQHYKWMDATERQTNIYKNQEKL